MNLLRLIIPFLVAAGAAYLMIYAGMGKHALEPKRPGRRCPSCGRAVHDCSCRR